MIDLAQLYARHAQRFDRARTRALMELPYFVEKGYRATGIDAVDEMLEMCRARFPEMTWRQTDMRRLDIPERFEIVIAWDSFFHLRPDDQREMFATFRKHTAPGGVLIFTSGLTEGEAIGGDLFGDALYHASLDTKEYARLLDRYGYSDSEHELGISRAGNRWVRGLSIEIAWGWLRHPPRSALSLWYQERFARGGPRARKVGIVALARKLLVALWRYVETGVLPEGAELKA